jgi:hypothetical protein
VKFVAVMLLAVAGAAAATHPAESTRSTATDLGTLVPWNRVGGISLGERRAVVYQGYGASNFHVLQRWGNNTQGYFRLHRSRLIVTFYGHHVGEIGFDTPYYRTKSGFGVGSRIPLGACHRTTTMTCEHRWHDFVYNAWNKGTPCQCWVKIGMGARSLPVTGRNFDNPWFFIYMKHGRATSFYLALKFVD